MSFLNSAVSNPSLRKIATVATLGLSALLLPLETANAAQRATYVVGNDRGGYLHDRLIELGNLQRNGTRVQIRGNICYSTCTMFLGLSGTCVNPNTTFGFHGPSKSGRRLAPQKFEYFSQVMANHYPTQLRDWFMREGRHRISGVYKIKGSELIRMGVKSCA
ncbi:MAG: hypothetical protein BM558_11940 [Roseobacter sp. MedPE-SW]|nr:MAG: hypothetical protein BM558_11940 [Roseobacter sp. MedPE-SW]